MDALCKQAREAQSEFLSLEVRESNQAALKLYEKLGLIPVNGIEELLSGWRKCRSDVSWTL